MENRTKTTDGFIKYVSNWLSTSALVLFRGINIFRIMLNLL